MSIKQRALLLKIWLLAGTLQGRCTFSGVSFVKFEGSLGKDLPTRNLYPNIKVWNGWGKKCGEFNETYKPRWDKHFLRALNGPYLPSALTKVCIYYTDLGFSRWLRPGCSPDDSSVRVASHIADMRKDAGHRIRCLVGSAATARRITRG